MDFKNPEPEYQQGRLTGGATGNPKGVAGGNLRNRLRENLPSRSRRARVSVCSDSQELIVTLSLPVNSIFVRGGYRLELARDRKISGLLACLLARRLRLPAYLSSLSPFAGKPAVLSRPAISALTTRIFSNSFQTRRESLVAVESRCAHEQRCPMLSWWQPRALTGAVTRDKGG